ncbi:hypothetical protein NADFUDRAFT_52705 [Nadsonia fulvescens var. elongata DSM 6958]|uniref:DNA-directed RNA polymerase III subunit RPC9 n=1 Tax=Nadsonia fulvescens var. elongata DSM 6958 TaxID=857566 RepID=A0A1E3PHN6_9ASCO|nr:hypothetical protein NADFUDRAFT_52705 [Nadsonia fulvescens var. elongata DSM 6958]
MKVENSRDKLLTCFEVFQHLKETKSKHRKSIVGIEQPMLRAENVETIVLELTGYLQKSPTFNQTEEGIVEFMINMGKFGLEKAELLQIINIAPTSLVTLFSLVEECDQRYTEEQTLEMIDIIRLTLGVKENIEPEEDVVVEESNN